MVSTALMNSPLLRLPPRSLLTVALILGSGAAGALLAQTAPATAGTTDAVEVVNATTQEEVNVAMATLGASGVGEVPGLNEVLAGQSGAAALFAPGANGAALGVIDLAGAASLSRVSIQVAPAAGRLVLMGMNEAGELIDLSTPEGAALLIADRQLDGSQTSLSFDVSKLTVKAVMIYWIPDVPGVALAVSQVGIFTRDTFVPDPVRAPAATVQAPIIPTPEVVQAAQEILVAGSQTPPATTTTTTTTSTAIAPLPETTVEQSKPISF